MRDEGVENTSLEPEQLQQKRITCQRFRDSRSQSLVRCARVRVSVTATVSGPASVDAMGDAVLDCCTFFGAVFVGLTDILAGTGDLEAV